MGKMKIQGVFPPMITPFKENDDVDYKAFVHNVEKWNDSGLAGYLVLGSNSEACFLDEAEKLELIRLTVQYAAKGRHIMVGTGMDSIRQTIALTNKAAALGAESALILTPVFFNGSMNSQALIDYFTQVADNVDIPILLYNVPKFTHVNIEAEAIRTLMEHKNIIGMKDSSGNIPQLAAYQNMTPDDFSVMIGTAGGWYPALTLGVTGGIHALANCCPNECVKIQELFNAGDWEASRALYHRVFPVNAAVTGKYGIAGLKYGCGRLGFQGGKVRSPLQPLSETQKKELDAIFMKAELL